MSIYRKLLPITYYPLACMNKVSNIIKPFNNKKNAKLRVLLFHDIAPDQYNIFRSQIEWLAKKWQFISPQDFAKALSGETVINKDSLLLTFDDGFSSDRVVVEDILNPLGIKGLFFVISEFAKLHIRTDQISFIQNNLYPASCGEQVPPHVDALANMSFADLEYLIETGHTIGSHTATHARLSEINDHQTLVEEIVNSADFLEKKLGIKIEHFSYSFGNLNSFCAEALSIARKRFPYIYTGMRGDNSKPVQPWAIRRDTIAISDSLSLIGAFTEGAADFRYKKNLMEYESWGYV